MNTVMHSVINIEKKRHCLFLVLTAGILFISLTGCENFQDSGSKTGTDLLSEKGEGRAPNPEVINGVATYHQSIRIGQTFYVPDSWNNIDER